MKRQCDPSPGKMAALIAILSGLLGLSGCSDSNIETAALNAGKVAEVREVETRQSAGQPFAPTQAMSLAGRQVADQQTQADAGAVARQVAPTEQAFPPLAAIAETPPVPADNPVTPAKIQLGRLLFFDDRLSGDGGTSCATCHEPYIGWGDGNAISMGYEGTEHWRNSQTTVNTGYLSKLFWAGESPSLEAQAANAIEGNVAGNGDPVMIEERLAQIPEYVRLFQEAFGVARPTYPLVLKAIATFERVAMNSTDSPFDKYMRGDTTAMSEPALRGMKLFEGKAKCIRCHNGPLLTDENYHAIGVPRNPLFDRVALYQITLRFQFYARGVPEHVYRAADRDLGLYYTTKRQSDVDRFRTPPLRYVAYTAPYMHNGVFEQLQQVIDFYDEGGGDSENKSELLEPLGLSDAEKADLLAFLQSLSGSEIGMSPPDLPAYEVLDDL